jgi:hypothetical protein
MTDQTPIDYNATEENAMSTIYLDAATQNKFSGLKEMTELRDESGRLVGHYIPAEPPCPWEPDLTETGIQRRINEPGGGGLAEFWNQKGGE